MVSSEAGLNREASRSPDTADHVEKHLSFRYRLRDYRPVIQDTTATNVAAAYNEAGSDYAAYADGDPARLYTFDGLHGYADRHVWTVLEAKLTDLRATGTSSVSILDAGCGPGTWLRRLVTRAHGLGFTNITARGFDIARAQIQRAHLLASDLIKLPGVDLTFDVADLMGELPEADASVDLTLCLYSVLSHLPVASLPKISAEIARVTAGHFITTVRSVGSTPTISVDSIEKARRFQHDNSSDRCEIEMFDGRDIIFNFHLFAASELRSNFADHFDIDELCGLDLFHNRFAPDPRWNPASLAVDNQFCNELERLEETYAKSSGFMERATHLMLVARRRQIAAMNEPKPNFATGINFPAACARLPHQKIRPMTR
jgi:SAM-dependent methyltransferase